MARVTANPQKSPAASRPALKPLPPAPATAKATKLSPRKTSTNVPSTSARYFLVQLSATAITSSSSSFDQISRDDAYRMSSPFLHLLWGRMHEKSPNLHAPVGAHRSGLFPSVSRQSLAGLFIPHDSDGVNRPLGRQTVRKPACG